MQAKRQSLNVIAPIVDYIDRILVDVIGIKCLVLDEDTTGMISLVYSQSQILKKDVYLIEKIEKLSTQKMQHMKVVYLVRPTQDNYDMIIRELREPRFCEYYLYFTNTISNYFIEKVAEVDDQDLVKQIQEVFMDFFAVQEDFFTLNIASTLPLTKVSQSWGPRENLILGRVAEGLLSVLYSLRKMPAIRYLQSSEFCSSLAQVLTQKLREEYDNSQSQFVPSNTLLLIIDRREDPITPLLNQWTYQAMLHELIGIQNNRVDIRQGHQALTSGAAASNQSEENEFVVSSFNDTFFQDNQYVNFGDLALNIKDFIDKVTAQKRQTVSLTSLEDMQKAVDKIPEIRKLSGNLSKHVSLSCEISKLVEERQLLKVSKVEQDLVSRDNRSEHYKAVMELLGDKLVQNYEKLKIVMLYAVKYENDDKIGKMKDILREQNLKQNSLNLINYAIDYAGKNKRSGDLFFDKNFLSKAQSKFKQVFKDVPNIYTQHQPYILHVLEQLSVGKLKESEFPFTNLNVSRDKPQEIIIFFAGGATFEEGKEIGLLNKQPNQPNILLGGTYIHNSRTFLAEISQLAFDIKNDTQIQIDQPAKSDNMFM